MATKSVLQQHPPTPLSVSADLHSGMQQIAQFNEDRKFSIEDSQSCASGYDSPAPVAQDGMATVPFHPAHLVSQGAPGIGLDIQYDTYHHSSSFYSDGHYNGLPTHPVFSGSPPTPRSTNENDDLHRQTRSGESVRSSRSPKRQPPARIRSTPKSRKKSGKDFNRKTPKLTAPLSVLTKNMASIPVRDMGAWVKRSIEVRRKEVEKKNGYITRPMNSFMLYRSAYAERTKQWCLQNNHQVVSSVSGESWPLEPPEVRDMYTEYAKIERLNHQNAHPDYKFSPSKSISAAKKRKAEFSDDDEPSDLDDADWAPGRSRPRSARRLDRTVGYPVNNMRANYYDRSYMSNGSGMSRPSWDVSSDSRHMSMPMHNEIYTQYFPPNIHPTMSMGHMDDLRMRKIDTPTTTMQFSSGHALLGLPGGNAADMMQSLHSHTGTPLTDEGQVDPMLLAYDGGHQALEPAMTHHGQILELEQDGVHGLLGAGAPQADYHPEQWQADSHLAAIEQGCEFEKWMEAS
ncbi:hypothetical protein BU24DRAFT_103679 [Aaosphaeria arxii CBS 175.79]|uniref:HMG box domain-containing protein n=1 Tax=Aaosphaeria arxii CBS 175.79 TaxID=1450172 RepID=A0A6A5Y2C0_9PLEO|nr:uncharacterized protein BU24DRAFT_103679 [Aaosphaeria arxii CBS 175.79]KAF2018724.1 hypothetical protein BU24DRAFT_103679 [Aaosphaeria arxii CBS 175.79]